VPAPVFASPSPPQCAGIAHSITSTCLAGSCCCALGAPHVLPSQQDWSQQHFLLSAPAASAELLLLPAGASGVRLPLFVQCSMLARTAIMCLKPLPTWQWLHLK
jgi:hypothetical protein